MYLSLDLRSDEIRTNRCSRSIAFKSGQKMELRALNKQKCPLHWTCGHITTYKRRSQYHLLTAFEKNRSGAPISSKYSMKPYIHSNKVCLSYLEEITFFKNTSKLFHLSFDWRCRIGKLFAKARLVLNLFKRTYQEH